MSIVETPLSRPLTLPSDHKARDYTFITNDPPAAKALIEELSPKQPLGKADKSWTKRDDKTKARIQACSCFEGEAISFTIRPDKPSTTIRKLKTAPKFRREKGFLDPVKKPEDAYLTTTEGLCQTILDVITARQSGALSGLLVISGSTNSMKTKNALGIIQLYLERQMNEWRGSYTNKKSGYALRKPHLVTAEDAIETYFRPLKEIPLSADGWLDGGSWPDYTPRKIPVDTPSMEQAVEDALRMTPTVFYAGEIRKSNDWKALYKLAHSHLVVATTHAGSVLGTFSALQSALRATTPTARSELASSLCAVIHMRPEKSMVGDPPKTISYNLPSIWCRTSLAIKLFSSDGLASVLPSFVAQLKGDADSYSLGRRTFAAALLAVGQRELKRNLDPHRDDIEGTSISWDLRGE